MSDDVFHLRMDGFSYQGDRAKTAFLMVGAHRNGNPDNSQTIVLNANDLRNYHVEDLIHLLDSSYDYSPPELDITVAFTECDLFPELVSAMLRSFVQEKMSIWKEEDREGFTELDDLLMSSGFWTLPSATAVMTNIFYRFHASVESSGRNLPDMIPFYRELFGFNNDGESPFGYEYYVRQLLDNASVDEPHDLLHLLDPTKSNRALIARAANIRYEIESVFYGGDDDVIDDGYRSY